MLLNISLGILPLPNWLALGPQYKPTLSNLFFCHSVKDLLEWRRNINLCNSLSMGIWEVFFILYSFLTVFFIHIFRDT